MIAETDGFEGWCLVEVMGHQRYAGYVREATLAGAGVLRVDVPALEAEGGHPAIPAFTKFVPPGSLYQVTPISEDAARLLARRIRADAVSVYCPELHPREEQPALMEHDEDCEREWFAGDDEDEE